MLQATGSKQKSSNSRHHPYDRRPGHQEISRPKTPDSEYPDERPSSSLDLNTSNEEWLKEYLHEEEQPSGDCQDLAGLPHPATPAPTKKLPGKQPRKQRYSGVTIISDGTYLPVSCYTELRTKFPGAFVKIRNYIRLEDTPEVLQSIPANKRKIVILFVGTRDVYGAIDHHLRRDNGPDRLLTSLSQLSIKKGLDTLSRSSTTPAESTYLCTIPPREPQTSTTERQYKNAAASFTTSIFNIINTGGYLQSQGPLTPDIGAKDRIIQCIKTELFQQRRL